MKKRGRKEVKKGQSNIITIVLIILLVLAAIIILWNVVGGMIRKSNEEIKIDIFINTIYIEKIKLYLTGEAELKIKREGGNVNITKVKFIFYTRDKKSYVFDKNIDIKPLESSVVNFTSNELSEFNNNDIEKVSVIPIFGSRLGVESSTKKDDTLPELTPGIVSWWKFDEDTNVARDSIGDFDGTLWGNAQLQDNQLITDGSGDYVSTVDNPLDMGTRNFTISAWIKTNDYSHSHRIISKRDGSNYGYELYLSDNLNGRLRAFVGSSSGISYGTDISNNNLADGNWHNVIALFDRSSNRVYGYVDGVLQTTSLNISARQGESLDNPAVLKIGSYITGTSDWNGSIDEVMVLNRTLIASEVQDIYAYQKTAHQ